MELLLGILGSILEGSLYASGGVPEDWLKGLAVVAAIVGVMVGLVALLAWMIG